MSGERDDVHYVESSVTIEPPQGEALTGAALDLVTFTPTQRGQKAQVHLPLGARARRAKWIADIVSWTLASVAIILILATVIVPATMKHPSMQTHWIGFGGAIAAVLVLAGVRLWVQGRFEPVLRRAPNRPGFIEMDLRNGAVVSEIERWLTELSEDDNG